MSSVRAAAERFGAPQPDHAARSAMEEAKRRCRIVAKGQAIFKIEPDHKRVEVFPEEIATRKRALTTKLLGQR